VGSGSVGDSANAYLPLRISAYGKSRQVGRQKARGAIEVQYDGTVTNYSIQISPSTWPGPGPDFPYTRFVGLNIAPLSPGGQGIAFLNFIPAGRPVPDSSIRGGSSEGDFVFDLALPMEDYTAIVDLVRNETHR
jgi:hypothetical protein